MLRVAHPKRAAFHTALLLVDFINDFDFPGGAALLRHARGAVHCASNLKARMKAAGVPVIYANDNFGQWQSDFPAVFQYVQEETAGAEIAKQVAQEKGDFFILKPKHSAFYLTPLELLLKNLEVKQLILCGLQTDICVLLTAHDAHMRDFRLIVPDDCSASERVANHRHALAHMEECLHTRVVGSSRITAGYLKQALAAPRGGGEGE